jgi:hypothetical protein
LDFAISGDKYLTYMLLNCRLGKKERKKERERERERECVCVFLFSDDVFTLLEVLILVQALIPVKSLEGWHRSLSYTIHYKYAASHPSLVIYFFASPPIKLKVESK